MIIKSKEDIQAVQSPRDPEHLIAYQGSYSDVSLVLTKVGRFRSVVIRVGHSSKIKEINQFIMRKLDFVYLIIYPMMNSLLKGNFNNATL